MNIAFYAPLKPPGHPTPSGDRRVARGLIAALEAIPAKVEIACRLRSRDASGDPDRQRRLQRLGSRLADRLIARYRARAPAQRPSHWFTYHLYYKAPDWIGPRVAGALGIPYLVAEASVAGKRAAGPWALSHAAVDAALAQASLVIGLNSADRAGVEPGLDCPYLQMAPFLESLPAPRQFRATLARSHGLDPRRPWLLTVAMMREGDKLASYRLLADALERLGRDDWQLLIVGDGPARAQVEAAFAPFGNRVRWAGLADDSLLTACYAVADLLVWPAINEAFGMALLEAQSAGLAVVAGDSGGVRDIVRSGITGLTPPVGDAAAFAAAVADLLDQPAHRHQFGNVARKIMAREHSLAAATERLAAALRCSSR